MKKNSNFVFMAVGACLVVSVGELLSTFAMGPFYPGYSQLKETMSALGASDSPISGPISAWWILMGFLLILFGLGFRRAFLERGVSALVASWLIMLYGFGEGFGSGAFKANYIAGEYTNSAMVHDTLGGIGVVAILILPLIMLWVISKEEMPRFHRLSKILFVTGIATVLLFMFRFSSSNDTFLAEYKGLWQRLFMLNTYIYLVVIAAIMWKQQVKKIASGL